MAKKVKIKQKVSDSSVEQLYPETTADIVSTTVSGLDATNVEGALTEINTKLDSLIVEAGTVTGVKGDAETDYRTGNVNITKANIGLGNVTNDAQVKRSEMGVASGVATLDGTGKVPAAQLPSYVDDVIEGTYVNATTFNDTEGQPVTPESGKIYVDTTTNKEYRWSGTQFSIISESLALGTTASTAYPGNLGQQNADDIAALELDVSTIEAKDQSQDEEILNIKNGTTKVGSATSADSATKLANMRTFNVTGDVVGTAQNFDGTQNVSIPVALTETGITAGVYSVLNVDAKGRATSGGQLIEYGVAGSTPTAALAIGGLFFEDMETA